MALTAVRLAAAAVAFAVLGAGLAACGSSSKSSSTSTSSAAATTAWADGLCNALDRWQTSVQAAVPKSGNLSVDSLKQSASSISDASHTLASDVGDLGKPPTPGAQEAKSAVQTLSDELSSQAKKIKDAASSISGAADVVPAVSTITASVTAMGDDLKTTAGRLKSAAADKQWQNAFADSSSCQKLSGS